MGNVAENVKQLKDLMQQARLHPACRKLHDNGTYITVNDKSRFAYGFRKGEGRAWAYRNVLNYLEQLS